MQIVTSADAQARATYNALLYCGKAPPFDAVWIVVELGRVSYLTSDGYALAWSQAEATTPDVIDDGVAFKLSREDLEALEKRSREGKKERVYLEFWVDECEIWYRGEDPAADMRMTDIFEDGTDEDSWDEINLVAFREIISQRELDLQARRVLLKPEYVRKLGQLKRDKDQGADFWIGEEENDPVLVKVGDGFRLAVQPIDHERHEAALGEGAIW